MIVVTGATGTVGSEVVRALAARGAEVRAFVRDPAKARERLGDGVELAVGDLADAHSVRAAVEGAYAVLLSCADDPGRVAWETSAVDAAAAAGGRRVVTLSTTAAAAGAPVAFWDWHGRIDEHLRAAAVDWVVLQSSFYMSNVLAEAERIARTGRLVAPAGDARIAMIDPRDVGAAAAAVLTGASEARRTYALTGPEAIGYERVAAEIAAATGRGVEFVDVPDEAFRRALVDGGVPAFVADQVVAIFGGLRAGVAAEVTGAVEVLTGRAPRSFAAFARHHAGALAPARAPAVAG
jgi:uncharacterized protein YbjT (DUF2867 family)